MNRNRDLNDRTDREEAVNSKISGSVDKLKGSAKQKWGKVTGDVSKETEGTFDKAKGEIKDKYSALKNREADLEEDINTLDENGRSKRS